MTKLDRFAGEGKPKKKRRANAGRFSHHTCFHGDAWQGLIGMPPDEVGVYWRIILLMYIRKAAITDDDRQMAQLCHCEVRVYRRIKTALAERGRIVLDDENGILYDERTIRELVDCGFFSEAQTARAMKRWNGVTPPRVIVDNDAKSDAPNVVPLNRDAAVSVAQVLDKVGAKSDVSLVDNVGPPEQKQCSSVQNGHANQYPIPNKQVSTSETPPKQRRTPPRRPPPKGGGAGPAHEGMTPAEWRADQLKRMALIPDGKDGDRVSASDAPTPADRKAKRGQR